MVLDVLDKEKGERRVRSSRVGSGSVQKTRGSPPTWPHSRDYELEKMLRRTRKATDDARNDELHDPNGRQHVPSKFSGKATREAAEGKMVAEPAFLVADFLAERLVAEAIFGRLFLSR